MTKKFDKGPKLSLTITTQGGKIVASHLSLSDHFSCTGADSFLLDWIESYLEGNPKPLSLTTGGPFQRQVMKTLSAIPFGKIVSYKELAELCGIPRGARAVGNACGRNPFPFFVPCHRVVRLNGKLGGFAYGLEIKKRLLDFELDFVHFLSRVR